MIESRRGNKPGVVGPHGALPLALAYAPQARADKPNDHLAELTTLETDERCDTCPWPTTCARDRTCWHTEAAADWKRTTLDLRTPQATEWTLERLHAWVHDFVHTHGRVPNWNDQYAKGNPQYHVLQRLGYPNMAALVTAAGYVPHKRRWKRT